MLKTITMMNKRTLMAILVMAIMSLPAIGQVKLGLRGGLTLGTLHFDRDMIDSDNRMGYCGGLVVDVGIPVTGLGIEGSVLYTHRSNKLTLGDETLKRHYIDIPVVVRYRLPLPAIEKIAAPLLFAGPSLSILFNEDATSDWESSRTSMSLTMGVGVDLVTRLRLTASYSIGISKAMSHITPDISGEKVTGKDRYWTLNAAVFF